MGADVILYSILTASTVYSLDQQKDAASKQRKAQREAAALQKKRSNVANARERAKQVRAARAQRATALAQSQVGEGGGGSGLQGVQANIGNQLAGNMGFLNKNSEISQDLSDLNTSSSASIARSRGRAAIGSGVAGLAKSAIPIFGESP